MPVETLLIWIIIGAIAGFLAGLITQGGGFGFFGNIIVGILGAAVAGFLFPRLGLSIPIGDMFIREIVVATLGAIILLFVIGLLRR